MGEYTPSEVLEAQDKAKQYEKGRKQADFYRTFIDLLEAKATEALDPEHTGEINNTLSLLNNFEALSPDNLRKYIEEAIEIANEKAGTKELMVSVNCEELSKMTVPNFFNYLSSLRSTLIKE
jgi:hypothetical protein